MHPLQPPSEERPDDGHVTRLLPELLLGGLRDVAASSVQAHLDACAPCAQALSDWSALLDSFAAALPHLPPRAELRAELLASIESFVELSPAREAQLDAVAGFFDLPSARARRLLADLEDEARWRPLALGLSMRPLRPGPAREGRHACLLRLLPEQQLPRHRHEGDEHVLILQGGLREDDGSRHHAGAHLHQRAGTAHAPVALPGEACIAAVLAGDVTFLAD